MKGIQTCQDEQCIFDITIYRFSGDQGLFKIPKSWCRECDLLVNAVEKIISQKELKGKTNLRIKSWWLWWWEPLFKFFAYHPPILVVNGKVVSQGIVPDKKTLLKTFVF